jgi:hypothetical protein
MNPTHPADWAQENATDDVARLAARVGLLGALGWLCVLAALLAPPLLCSGAVLYGPEYALTPTGMTLTLIGLMVPLVALAAWAVPLRAAQGIYAGRLRLALIAAKHRWAFREQPDAGQRAFLQTFQTVRDEAEGIGALAWSRGRRPKVVTDLWLVLAKHTAFVFTDAARDVPGMIIQPRGEHAGIEVPGQAEFNESFALLTAYATVPEATACLTPELARFCLDEGDVTVEVRGGHVLVFWERGIIKPDEFDERLERAGEVVKLLRAG